MIVKRRAGQHGGITIGFRLGTTAGIDSPTVTDDQNDRLFGHKEFKKADRLQRASHSPKQLHTTGRLAAFDPANVLWNSSAQSSSDSSPARWPSFSRREKIPADASSPSSWASPDP